MMSRTGNRTNRRQKSEARGRNFCFSLSSVVCHLSSGFTLIELLIAVVVIAVGMVFVSGALSRCLAVLTTSEKIIDANYLLNQKMWEISRAYEENGSEEGAWSAKFEEPYADFGWAETVQPVSQDFGNQTRFVQESLNEGIFAIVWKQGRELRNVSVDMFVKKKKE